jgi:hypothetical protein
MIAWRIFLVISVLSACSKSIDPRSHDQENCGTPWVMSPTTQGRVIVPPDLGRELEQQLPKGVLANDACWTIGNGGRLTGDFEEDKTNTIFVFEYKDAHWTLVDTKTETIVRNPYGNGDKVK